ncbi:hypothetical protein MLD38_033916 [Melastoma candidum]|uniref:Uncharacterized protein n=1 Tax=Melastoma candidum TaxID=119954 RepID=A0ACB9MAK8_9MYRT|nr:hypothetical protein MLD38_033916 [Melastoma candidum]
MSNTLILGIQLLNAMYGNGATSVLLEIVFLQSIAWYNLLFFLFELDTNESSHDDANRSFRCRPEEG